MIREANKQVDHLVGSCGDLDIGTQLIGFGIQIIRLQIVPGENIVVVPGLVKLQVDLLCIGIDDDNACISRGIMVRVGDDTNDQVYANILVTNVIMEGQHSLTGQLLDHINDFVECANFNTQLSQLGFYLLHIGQEGFRGDTGIGVASFQDAQLFQQDIHPARHIHIDIALNGIQTNVRIKICGDTCRDNGLVRSQSRDIDRANGYKLINSMLVAIPLDSFILHIGGRLGRLNHQSANALASVGDVTGVIPNNDNCSDGVRTSVDRSHLACIRNTIGLNAHIEVLDDVIVDFVACLITVTILLVGNQQVAFHSVLRNVEEFVVTLVIYSTACIDEVNIQGLSHDNDGTDQRLRVEHFVAKIDDHCDLNISANIQLGLIHFEGNVAIDVHTQENLANLCSGLFEGVTIIIDIDCMGTGVESTTAQQSVSNDVVLIILVPGQIDLGTIGVDGDNAHAEVGLVVVVSADSTDQVHTDVGGQVAANGNHHVSGVSGQTGEHIQQHISISGVLSILQKLTNSGYALLQVRQLHGSAISKTDVGAQGAIDGAVQSAKQLLQLLGQHQLDITNDALDFLALHVHIGYVQANDKVDGIHAGGVSDHGHGVAQVGLPLDQAVVNLHIHNGLVDHHSSSSSACLVIDVTGEPDGDVGALGSRQVGHIGDELNQLSTADAVALCVIDAFH